MKSGEFADLLNALGGALGAHPLGPALAALAPGFAARSETPAKTSAAALARLAVADPEGPETAGCAAEGARLQALADALAPHLKPGARGDLGALAAALEGRGALPLAALAEAWSASGEPERPEAPPAGAAAVAEIERHAAALKSALGTAEAFDTALAALEAAARPRSGPLMAGDVAAVARAVLDRPAGKTKAEALAALRSAHAEILEARARVAARDGRSAG